MLRGALARRNSPLERDLDGRGDEHDRDDLDQIAGEERNDAGSQGSGQGHSGLSYEPGCAENVENGSGKEHGDKHDGVFADAGSVSSIEVVKKAGDKGHGDVSDDVTAGDAESDADAAGPAGKNGDTDAAEQYIDDLAEGSEFRTKEDPREENRESSEGDRDFSGQRDGDRSQNASNCGAEGAENKIMCCQFHVV